MLLLYTSFRPTAIIPTLPKPHTYPIYPPPSYIFTADLPGAPRRKRTRDYPSWRLLRDKVIPSLKDVRNLRGDIKRQKGKLQPVFNPDERRHQLPLAHSHPLMQQLTEALRKDGALSDRTLGKSVALHSNAGCVVQDWHVDFNPLCKRVKGQERE